MSSGRTHSSSSSKSRRSAAKPSGGAEGDSITALPTFSLLTAAGATDPTRRPHRSSKSSSGEDKKRSSSSLIPSSTNSKESSHDKEPMGSKEKGKETAAASASSPKVRGHSSSSSTHHHRHSSRDSTAHHLSSNAILRQIYHDLSFTGGVHTQLLTPGSFFGICLSVLQHTLRSFSPETLVVKRVSHSRSLSRHGGADDEKASDAGSRASSRHSRHSSSSSAVDGGGGGGHSRRSHSSRNADLDTSAMSATRYAHRRHRSTSSEQRRQQHSSGGSADSPASVTTATTPAGVLSRRSRGSAGEIPRRSASAEVLAAPRSHRKGGEASAASGSDVEGAEEAVKKVRRSRSDESRLSGSNKKTSRAGRTVSSSRSAGGGDLSSSQLPSSANSSFGSSHGRPSVLGSFTGGVSRGLPPPPPPPPMIGKPPLSGRRPSTSTPPISPRSAAAAATGDGAKGRHGSSDGHHPHRSRSSRSDTASDRHEEEKGKSATPRKQHVTWKEWLASVDATQPAYLLAHVLRATPVAALHFLCELKRQLVALPMLAHCADVAPNVHSALARFTKACSSSSSSNASSGTSGGAVRRRGTTASAAAGKSASVRGDDTEWLGTRFGANFMLLRVVLRMWHRYIEEVLFLDDSLVVRNLRSKRISRQAAGWTLRLLSHTVLDPVFLSVLSPILCLSVTDFSSQSREVKYTIPGLLRGFALGCASVLVERIVMPTCSQLVNRAVITVCETTEYVLMRRYVMTWPDDDSADETESDDEGSDGDVSEGASQASVSPAVTPRGNGGRSSSSHSARHRRRSSSSSAGRTKTTDNAASSSVDKTAKTGKREKDSADTEEAMAKAPSSDAEKGTADSDTAAADAAAKAAEKEAHRRHRKAQKERREKRQQRKERRQRREATTRHAILRAIGYRIASGLIAQCLVEHPIGVIVELLRGRAVMHVTGMLAPYDNIARDNAQTAVYMASWANVKSLLKEAFSPSLLSSGGGDAGQESAPAPVMLRVLRQAGTDMGHELGMLSASVLETSGQAKPLEALAQRVSDKVAAGGRPTAKESVELMSRWLLSFSPLYYGVQFTAIDKLLGFYMAVWTRLTRQ